MRWCRPCNARYKHHRERNAALQVYIKRLCVRVRALVRVYARAVEVLGRRPSGPDPASLPLSVSPSGASPPTLSSLSTNGRKIVKAGAGPCSANHLCLICLVLRTPCGRRSASKAFWRAVAAAGAGCFGFWSRAGRHGRWRVSDRCHAWTLRCQSTRPPTHLSPFFQSRPPWTTHNPSPQGPTLQCMYLYYTLNLAY